jgi:hypothetical protein
MKLRPTWSDEFASPRGRFSSADASSNAAEFTSRGEHELAAGHLELAAGALGHQVIDPAAGAVGHDPAVAHAGLQPCRSWWPEFPGCAPRVVPHPAGGSEHAGRELHVQHPPPERVARLLRDDRGDVSLALHQQIARALERPAPLGRRRRRPAGGRRLHRRQRGAGVLASSGRRAAH